MHEVVLTEDAAGDFENAYRWYAERSEPAAERFSKAVEKALQEIATQPKTWPSVSRRARFYKLNRYPYCVFYRTTRTTIYVVAIRHGRRRPGYWKRRP
jgi:plasmid stabilization system protein ParE